MALADTDKLTHAVRVVAKVAQREGLDVEDVVVLKDYSNILLHLRPANVVARVALEMGDFRQGDAWLRREVSVASFLTQKGAPASSPCRKIAPGPYHEEGLVFSFWDYFAEKNAPADAYDCGKALRECHTALLDFHPEADSGFEDDISIVAGLEEAQRLYAYLVSESVISSNDAQFLANFGKHVIQRIKKMDLPLQLIHGDAHLGNVINAEKKVIWNDWEDCFMGPIFWDFACLICKARVLGEDKERAHDALVGYGSAIDEEVLDLFVSARAFQITSWLFVISRQKGIAPTKALPWLRYLRSR